MHSIFNMKITPEHPVLALQNIQRGLNYVHIKNRLLSEKITPEWVDASKLTTDDFVTYTIPEYINDIEEITQDDCYMYGVILGDGCIENQSTTGYISLHTHNKKHILDFAIKYFENKCIKYSINVNDNTTRIRWNKTINMPFRYGEVYDSNKNKYINHKWLNLPIDKSKYILKGLIDTDGCVNKEIVFDNTSLKLIESVRFLFLKFGVLTSGYVRNRIGQYHQTLKGLIITKKISYCLRIPKTEDICNLVNIPYNETNFQKFFRYKNMLFSRITNIKTEKYNGTLYDLQMKQEHNYMIHNGLVHNGGGRRHGSFAIYLEPWHADIEKFLEMRKNHGDEELKARDLFYALWIPDLFMERVKANAKWTLMCPDECPGLADVYGQAFVDLYTKYETNGKGRATVNARDLWLKVLDAQMETGTPYLCYKDAANQKSNQKNIGTIKSSNLCCEINEVSTSEETAVCNLASIGLPTFIEYSANKPVFNYEKLKQIAKVVTNNLNKVIDVNYYPTQKTKVSNLKHRPIGIGVQGLADVFALLDLPFYSDEAKEINKRIFETIYYGALEQSMELAKEEGPYETFQGSPASQGILQFDMWQTAQKEGSSSTQCAPLALDWSSLKANIMKYGLRNSLLIAPMPTASTSQILGFNECFEPFTSNIYSRRTLAGEFALTNKYLMKELIDMGLWNTELKNNIIANQGSIQHITTLPEHMRNKYKTVWEIPMRHIIDMAADRGQYICQSQSMNLWQEDPTYASLTSMHFYAWQKGLKTGIYYLRRRAKHRAQQFTIEPKKEEECLMCSA